MLRREVAQRVAFLDPDRQDLVGLRERAMPGQAENAQHRPEDAHHPARTTSVVLRATHRSTFTGPEP